MEITIRHLGAVKFEATARGHSLICDQPPENGGTDSGMTPPELMLASLGTCAGFYAAQYLKARGLSSAGLEVKVNCEKATGPARLGSFRIDVNAPFAPADHQAGLLRAVKACLIHNTLTHMPAIETEVHTAVLIESGVSNAN